MKRTTDDTVKKISEDEKLEQIMKKEAAKKKP